jgi:hypothetical protein
MGENQSALLKESETGRAVTFYSHTEKGRKQMEIAVQNWQRLSDAVGLVIRTTESESWP